MSNAKPAPLFSAVKRAGGLLFLSGIGPRTPEGETPGLGLDHNGYYSIFDFELQCRTVFDNVKKVLENNDAKWDDLVDVTIFLVDMQRDFRIFNKIYAEYFPDNKPCRTTVEVSALPSSFAIEVKCVAYIGK